MTTLAGSGSPPYMSPERGTCIVSMSGAKHTGQDAGTGPTSRDIALRMKGIETWVK